jgi:copper chaperone CopZ
MNWGLSNRNLHRSIILKLNNFIFMKSKIISFRLVFFIFIFSISTHHFNAQSSNPRRTSAIIKSTVECEFCKKFVEKKLVRKKGIRSVVADYNTHEITVVYNSRRTNIETIRNQIAEMGYDADGVPANNRKNRPKKHSNPNGN